MDKQITPHYLGKRSFPLGGGLRGLLERYETFNLATYATELLLNEVGNTRELKRGVAKAKARKIYTFARDATIGEYRTEGIMLLPYTEARKIDFRDRECITKLVQALQEARKDLVTLAERTSVVWNSFHNAGGKEELQDLYGEANKRLTLLIAYRTLGRKEVYEEIDRELDEIVREVNASIK
ncbi:MAG: hypothetical protein AABW89_05190 [Nanoarchaeota archaeon]